MTTPKTKPKQSRISNVWSVSKKTKSTKETLIKDRAIPSSQQESIVNNISNEKVQPTSEDAYFHKYSNGSAVNNVSAVLPDEPPPFDDDDANEGLIPNLNVLPLSPTRQLPFQGTTTNEEKEIVSDVNSSLLFQAMPNTSSLLNLKSSIVYSVASTIAATSKILPLSNHFEFLLKLLGAIDSAMLFSSGRSEIPFVWHRAQKSIENILGRTISLEHLAEIQSVLLVGEFNTNLKVAPYTFSLIKINWKCSKKVNSLLIELNTTSSSIIGTPDSSTKAATFISHKMLHDRKEYFRLALLNVMKKAHNEFLEENHIHCSTTTSQDTNRELQKWHPKFNVEKVKISILENAVPSGLLDRDEPDSTTTTNKIFDLKKTEKKQEECKEISKAAPVVVASAASRATSLLERIREKERLKLENEMFNSQKQSEVALSISNSLKSFAESLYFLFNSAKKNVMLMSEIQSKLQDSSNCYSKEVTLKNCLLLKEKFSDFLELKSNDSLVKINRAKYSLGELLNKLNGI